MEKILKKIKFHTIPSINFNEFRDLPSLNIYKISQIPLYKCDYGVLFCSKIGN